MSTFLLPLEPVTSLDAYLAAGGRAGVETAQRIRSAMEEAERQVTPDLTPEQERKLQKLKQQHHRMLIHHGFMPPPADSPAPP